MVLASGKVPGGERTDVRFAVIEALDTADGGEPTVRRIARTREPLAPRADWSLLPVDFQPSELRDGSARLEPSATGFDERTSLDSLDFAEYDVAAGRRAFGVRTVRSEGTAGGFGSFETLTLYLVDGETVRPILDVPTGIFRMIAADWNQDGTRQHDIAEAELVVRMQPHAQRMATVLLTPRGIRHSLAFEWDQEKNAYTCP